MSVPQPHFPVSLLEGGIENMVLRYILHVQDRRWSPPPVSTSYIHSTSPRKKHSSGTTNCRFAGRAEIALPRKFLKQKNFFCFVFKPKVQIRHFESTFMELRDQRFCTLKLSQPYKESKKNYMFSFGRVENLCMSPVSPVFHTEVTVSIVLL